MCLHRVRCAVEIAPMTTIAILSLPVSVLLNYGAMAMNGNVFPIMLVRLVPGDVVSVDVITLMSLKKMVAPFIEAFQGS